MTTTVTRQLPPWDGQGTGGAKGMTMAQRLTLFQWVTWDTEPIDRVEAGAHLVVCGGTGACVVRVRRGPKGGWTGASFITHAADLPAPTAMRQRKTTDGKVIEAITLYYGWKQQRVGPGQKGNSPVPLPNNIFGEHYRAHLVLHA